MESPICREIGLDRNLFVGKLGSTEICMSENWARTKSVCRKIGLERNLFVGKLCSNEICLSANWARTKSVCRKLASNEISLLANCGRASHRKFS